MRTQPQNTQELSQYTTNPSVTSDKVNIKAEVSLSFNSWKLLSYDYDHSNLTFFLVKVVKGEAIDSNQSTYVLQYRAKPKKIWISVGVKGLGQFLTTSVFFGSAPILSREISNKEKQLISTESHLLHLEKSWCSLRTINTTVKLFICSSLLLEFTKISLINTITKESRWFQKTLFIRLINEVGY